MPNEIRTTKMLLDKRKKKLHEIDLLENQVKQKNEILFKENIELAENHSKLHERIIKSTKELNGLFDAVEVLSKTESKIIEDVSGLQELRRNEIDNVKQIYIYLENNLCDYENEVKRLVKEANGIHKESVKEQSKIQRQKRDLKIYQNRLQKEYDKLNFGKVILVE